MINTITNANAYMNGGTLAGKLEEIQLPAIKFKMEDYAALGIFSELELPSGLEKMEAQLKWNAIYGDNIKLESPTTSVSLTVKSNMKKHDAGGVIKNIPVSATLSGVFKELPLGTFKSNAKVDGLEHKMTVYYLKLEVEGKLIYEVDIFNNILKVGEKDVLESFRLNQ